MMNDNKTSKRLALALSLSVMCLAGAPSAFAQFTWNNDWTVKDGNNLRAAVDYTIGSGSAIISPNGAGTADPAGFWFRGWVNNGAADLNATYATSKLLFHDGPFSGTNGHTISGTGALVFKGSPVGGAVSYGIAFGSDFPGQNVTQAVNVDIYLSDGQVAFANTTMPQFSDTLAFGTVSDRKTIQGLQLDNSNTVTSLMLFGNANGIINSHIVDGTGQGAFTGTAALALNMVSTGTWTLTGSNTYTGPTTVSGGGALVLDNTSLNAQKISTDTLTLGTTVPDGQYHLLGGGASVLFIGSDEAASSQTVAALNVNFGGNSLTVNAGAGQTAVFNVNGITRGAGATVDFSVNSGGTITTTNDAGDLGAWATFNKNDFATVSGGVIGAATYGAWGTGSNVSLSTDESQSGATAKKLKIDAPLTLTLTGSNTLTDGGILFTENAGAGPATISGGTLTADNGEFVIQQHNTAGALDISSALSAAILTKAGAGVFKLSGTSNATTVNLNGGTLQLGADNALATDAVLWLNNAGTVFDLNGYDQTLADFRNTNLFFGQMAIDAGMSSVVGNFKAGTISTLTLNIATTPSERWTMDLAEGDGAVLNLVKTGGGNVYLNSHSGANNMNMSSYSNAGWGRLPEKMYDQISGNISVQGGTLYLQRTILSFGGLDVSAGAMLYLDQGNTAVTRLTGSGAVGGDWKKGLFVNLAGASEANVFDGQVYNYSGNLLFNGAGSFKFSVAQTTTGYWMIAADGKTFVEMPGITAAVGAVQGNYYYHAPIQVAGQGLFKLTGTSGVVAGLGGAGANLGISMAGGTLWIAPDATGDDVTVSGMANVNGNTTFAYGFLGECVYGLSQPYVYGNSTLLLDRGGNTSLTFKIGTDATNSSTAPKLQRGNGEVSTWVNTGNRGTLVIAAANDGLAGLGTTENFVLLGNESQMPKLTNGIVNTSIVGADYQTGVGSFLTHTYNNGSAVLKAATYQTDLTVSTATNVVIVSAPVTLGTDSVAYALRNDSVITNDYTLTLGTGQSGDQTGLIMNNAVIAGAGTVTTGAAELTLYVSGSNRIENTLAYSNTQNTPGLTLFGDGLLQLSGALPLGYVTLNSGVLEIDSPAMIQYGGNIQLQGGVLQTSGSFTRGINNPGQSGAFQWYAGGFAASSTAGLVVNIYNNGSKLYWTAGAGNVTIMQDQTVMTFGSKTAKGWVEFRNDLDLGAANTMSDAGTDYSAYGYSTDMFKYGSHMQRVIEVVDNPSTDKDYAMFTGVISAADEFKGISKVGDGLLILIGNNTYVGPTSIAEGTLAIYADSGLGAAPDAAAPYTGYVNRGTVLINGGAALYAGGEAAGMVINANRQILLASGADGARGANIAVQTGFTAEFAGRLGDSVDEQGSLLVNGAAGGMANDNIGGTLQLTGNSTISGFTEVVKGTLLVDGALSTANVVINAGATLGGAGELVTSVGGITVSGILDATDALTLSLATGQKLNFAADSTLLVDANSALNFAVAGDWLTGSGNATLELTGNFDYATQYTVLTNITTKDFSFATISGYDTANYEAQWEWMNNNSYILTFEVIPEPSTWALIVTGVALLTVLRRRR
ncbi:MAG: autotransporter-associated beta strand repeat-containing protein [Verrucomicrobiales bacterium]|jgi:autotransporter-associated beta strand protein|nr:autotransporter-associated beta strand repeat-containing protein [Verrucomicrobiales bacterium]